MKRALGAMAANWLRKPENQERMKRTARDVWGRFQQHRDARKSSRTGVAKPDAAPQPDRQRPTDRDD